jgi:hypothetical protein
MKCGWSEPQTDVSAPGGRQGYSEALPGHDVAAVVSTAPGCAISAGRDDSALPTAPDFLVGSRSDRSANPPWIVAAVAWKICQQRRQLRIRPTLQALV